MRITQCLLLFPFLASCFARQNLVIRDTTSSDAPFVPQTAGPSGTLIKPVGGTQYVNHVGNVGNVEVIYRGVSDGSNQFGARTCTIDLHLVPKSLKPIHSHAFNTSDPSVISVSGQLSLVKKPESQAELVVVVITIDGVWNATS